MEHSSTNVSSDNLDTNTKQENSVAHNAHVVKLDSVNDIGEKYDEKPYIDPDIQKKLVRKLDLRIVAWCSLALFVNNINRYNMRKRRTYYNNGLIIIMRVSISIIMIY